MYVDDIDDLDEAVALLEDVLDVRAHVYPGDRQGIEQADWDVEDVRERVEFLRSEVW